MPEGPCKLCGATDYALSMGGPTICPACDCGGAEAGLRRQLEAARQEIQALKSGHVVTVDPSRKTDKPIALFDLDGSLADYESALTQDLIDIASPDEPPPEIYNPPPYLKKRIDLIRQVPGWWRTLDLLDAGFGVFEAATDLGFDTRVLTKGPQSCVNAWTEKLEWCQDYLPDDTQVTITRDKSSVYGRVLVEDYVPFLKGWLNQRPRGLGILLENEHNKGFKHPRVFVFDGSMAKEQQLIAVLEAARDREDGQPLCLEGIL